VQIAADQFGSAALRNDGTVWTWGRLDSLGDLPNSVVPIQVSGISHVTSIGMGGAHILAIRQDGTVWAWGDNDGGQLGRQDVRATGTPVQVRGTGGKGYLSGVTVVAGGAVTSVAVRRDGSVLTWGGAFNYTHDSAVFPHRVSGLPTCAPSQHAVRTSLGWPLTARYGGGATPMRA
jgi:alpha-tubulin suppressor-like RCC1 family protein